MAARIRYNFNAIRGLLTDPGTKRVILDKVNDVEAALNSAGVETRTDHQDGPRRIRGAVIAGYERGATAEGTRRNLLRALDAARDAR